MCKDKNVCFIHWAHINNKDCCFNNAESGAKVCRCGAALPRTQEEFETWGNTR